MGKKTEVWDLKKISFMLKCVLPNESLSSNDITIAIHGNQSYYWLLLLVTGIYCLQLIFPNLTNDLKYTPLFSRSNLSPNVKLSISKDVQKNVLWALKGTGVLHSEKWHYWNKYSFPNKITLIDNHFTINLVAAKY